MAQSSLLDISLARFKQVIETNVGSCFLCSKAFVKQFEGDDGAIVNVSSLASKTGSPFEYIDYAASKGAVDTLTKGLSLELVGRNIRVNGVRPGFITTDTPMVESPTGLSAWHHKYRCDGVDHLKKWHRPLFGYYLIKHLM